MPALVAGIHVLLACKHDVDGRAISAFTRVFDGAMPGHDDKKSHGRAKRN